MSLIAIGSGRGISTEARYLNSQQHRPGLRAQGSASVLSWCLLNWEQAAYLQACCKPAASTGQQA